MQLGPSRWWGITQGHDIPGGVAVPRYRRPAACNVTVSHEGKLSERKAVEIRWDGSAGALMISTVPIGFP